MKYATQYAAEVAKKYQKKTLWQRLVAGLACVVVFCTTYALILPGITLDTPLEVGSAASAPSEAEASGFPAQEFAGHAGDVSVAVAAPQGAFPTDTVMTVGPASAEAVQAAAAAVNADSAAVQAVDITFRDQSGQEIEPAVPISVTLASGLVADAENAVVVHVDGEAQAEVIEETTVEGETVTFEADAFSVYAIIGKDENNNDIDPRYIYEFYVGTDRVETKFIKGGDLLPQPEVPDIPSQYNAFVGWYIGGTKNEETEVWSGGNPATFGTLSKEALDAALEAFYATDEYKNRQEDAYPDNVIRVHARFADMVTVTFMVAGEDDEGEKVDKIVTTKSVARGGSVNISGVTATPPSGDLGFVGWVTAENSDTVLTDRYTASDDATLYAVFAEGCTLTFVTGDGATPVNSQFVASGKTTIKPGDPKRAGYTFGGWYNGTADEDGNVTYDTKFTFGQTLAENTTLYAKWSANKVNYTVLFWQQKVSDDKGAADDAKTYDYVSSETRTAETGSTVNAATADRGLATSDSAYTGFHYGRADTDVVVAGDGSTILNVYYDRNLITMTFEMEYTYSQHGRNDRLDTSKIYFYKYDNQYYNAQYGSQWGWYSFYGSGSNDYASNIQTQNLYSRTATETQSYTGLYGQTLAQNGYTWPSTVDGQNYAWQYTNNSGNNISMTFLDTFILTPATATEVTFNQDNSYYSGTIHFYKEDANGNWEEDISAAGTGTSFNISDKYTGYYAYQYSTDNRNWTTLGTPNATTGYYANVATYTNLYIRYKRNTYTLDFMNGSQTVDSASLLYGADLKTVTPPADPTAPDGVTGDSYKFLGWYTAPTGGVKLDFTTIDETMPANNRIAYAQWQAEQVTVTYDAAGGKFWDGSGTRTDSIDYNTTAVDYNMTNGRAGYEFLGWYYEDPDYGWQPWNFTDPVTDDLTLTAEWYSDVAVSIVYKVKSVDENGNETWIEATLEGEAKLDTKSYLDGAEVILQGYVTEDTFAGWRMSDPQTGEFSDTGAFYSPGDSFVVSEELDPDHDKKIVLYAVYDEPNTTTLTFNANGGAFGEDVTTAEDGTHVLTLTNNEGVDLDEVENPTRDGYMFLGWATSRDATVAEYTADGTSAKEIAVDNIDAADGNVLYAVWGVMLPNTGGPGREGFVITGFALVLLGGSLLYIHSSKRKGAKRASP